MFENMSGTIILSCLQGHMGKAWVDEPENPTVAQILVGTFSFYAGNPHTKIAKELLCNLPEHTLVIVHSDEWKNRIEGVHKGSEKLQRYSFRKDPEDPDRTHLNPF